MKFETRKQAAEYKALLESDLRFVYCHKIVKTVGWFFDRKTGEYFEQTCFTLVLK